MRRQQPYIIIMLHVITACLYLVAPPVVLSSISLSKPGCQEHCGNITIPFPFGIGDKCSANSSFTLTCTNSTNPPTLILASMNLEVGEIFLNGTIIVNVPLSPLNCSNHPITETFPLSSGTPFTISALYNTLVNLACGTTVWLRINESIAGECTPYCDARSYDTSCTDFNCCQIEIRNRIHQLQYSYQSSRASFPCPGHVFPVDKKWFQLEYAKRKGHWNGVLDPFSGELGYVPLVFEWEVDNLAHNSVGSTCFYYSSGSSFGYFEYYHQSTRAYCVCEEGYEGNPYLPGGCIDIDECSNATLVDIHCGGSGTCVNTNGSFQCQNSYGYWHTGRLLGILNGIIYLSFIIAIVIGAVIFFYGVWRSGNAFRKLIQAIRSYHFYKRNGGLLLEQHLASTENGLEKTKLFGARELAQATDHYNENRILGRGGQGTVYKGMLTDGKIVADWVLFRD